MPDENQINPENSKIEVVKRMCCNFQSDNKRTRKQTLIDFENYFRNEQFSNQDLRLLFNEIHIHVINTLRDKSEAVREQGIQFLQHLIIDKLPLNDYYITYIIPVLVERLGSVEIIEESEEIRLQLVRFLHAIILKYSNTSQLKPFLNEIIIILKETVKDKFPDVKEASCKCIVDLAKALPTDFHMQAENLVKPIVTAFTHQRYKIRVEAIKCVGEVILHCTHKGLEEALTPMAERLFDSIPLVRQTVAEVAGRWLLEYRDRYSFFAKLLPLLLTGLNDEVPETRDLSYSIWVKVGLQYLNENEKDLKNKLDFLTTLPEFYPKHLTRPNLGCRELVQRNVGKICMALSRELNHSWQHDVKIRCSQLLCAIAFHAEDGITQNLQEILPAMYTTARDEDEKVVMNIIQASELMGNFVPVETWLKLIIPTIENGPHYGHFTVLSGLIEGAPEPRINPHLSEISSILSDKNFCQSRKVKYQRELAKCIKAIIKKCRKDDETVGRDIFVIAITLIGLRDKDNEMIINETLLDDLCKCLGFSSTYELWHKYMRDILQVINNDPKLWTVNTAERCTFDVVILNSGEAFGENLDMISDILRHCLHPDADPEAKLKTFVSLSMAFENKEVIFRNAKDLDSFLKKIVDDVLVPALVWHAGRIAEAMRTMAASCLASALNPGVSDFRLFSSSEVFRHTYDNLMPLLITLMEDNSYTSRQLAVENVNFLKQTAVKLGCWETSDFIMIYPEILKRLDDPIDKVRMFTLKTLPDILKDVPSKLEEVTFKSHTEHVVNTLLTHFDDNSEEVRSLVFESLKCVAIFNGKLLQQKVERHKPLLRNKKGCDELLEYLSKNETIYT